MLDIISLPGLVYKYRHPFHRLPFHTPGCVLGAAEDFKLDVIPLVSL